MRRRALLSVALVSLISTPLACGTRGSSQGSGENVIRAGQPIQGGTVDKTDSAVVAILIDTPQGMSLCSGALIAPNLVLSAHHCVAPSYTTACTSNGFGATYSPTSFIVTTSYSAAANVFNSGGSLPTPDGVTWFGVGSVAVPGNDICGQDMSALTLKTPVTSVCPLIPRVDTEIADGDGYTAIGFGITSPNGQTAGTRYDVTGMTVQCVTDCMDPSQSATLEWLGGSSQPKGTCEGDSGGPAIDATGRIIGTVSRGPAGACNSTVYESVYGEATWIKSVATAAATSGGYAPAGWITGGATSNPANGYCSGSAGDAGTNDGGATDAIAGDGATTDAGASDGGMLAAPTTCSQADGQIGCCDGNTLYYCSPTGTLQKQSCSGATCGWNASAGYYDCVAPPGGADPSGTYPLACGGTASTDAGVDSGPATDGGTVIDSGTVTDSGIAADTGIMADSGTIADSGIMADSGAGTDSGVAIDSGMIIVPDAAIDSGVVIDPDAAIDSGAAADSGASADATLDGGGDADVIDATGDDASFDSGSAGDDSGWPAFDAATSGGDAGNGVDASRTPVDASTANGSCACTTAGATRSSSWPAWIVVGLAAMALRRRRPRA